MTKHQPVLLKEVLLQLEPKSGQVIIDGTVGGGGHALAILRAILPKGKLIGFDRDEAALKIAKSTLGNSKQVHLFHAPYSQMVEMVQSAGYEQVDGVLLDLGYSSDQIDDVGRGFSFQSKGPLDLRYDQTQDLPTWQKLRQVSESELADILYRYGDESKSRQLAKNIVQTVKQDNLKTVEDLLEVIYQVKGRGSRFHHPATLVWQALRIWCNDEYRELENGLKAALKILKPGGRLLVITFHSGEDRIVKSFMRESAQDCLCPPAQPICTCHHKAELKIVSKKAIKAKSEEVKLNPRARSAQLRVAYKI